MNDSTLTGALLTRLDALTAKMGVAATEVWSVWTGTSWRPLSNTVSLFVIGLLLVAGGTVALKKAFKSNETAGYDDPRPVMFGVPGGVAMLVGGIMALAALLDLANAIAYLVEPRLYALDQLRELVGK